MKKLILLTMSLCALLNYQSSAQSSLNLYKNNGSMDSYLFNDIRKFTFDTLGSTMYLYKNNGAKVNYLMDDIRKLMFKTDNSIIQIIYPKITLSSSSINAGQSITISGSDFKSGSKAVLSISGQNFSQSKTVSASGTGTFSYSFATTTTMPAGTYSVQVRDSITGYTTPTKSFIIKSPTQTQAKPTLEIIYPDKSFTIDPNTHFFDVNWKDKMLTGSNYTLTGSERNYKYNIEISYDNGATWKNVGSKQGQEYINNYVIGSQYITPTTPGNNCFVRVVDAYNAYNADTTPVFTVTNNVSTGNLKVNFKWDYSYPTPSVPVSGVAADGVARIYLELSKKNTAQGAAFSSVSVSLNDDGVNNSFTKLGKVKTTTQTTSYNIEANGITDTTATDNTANKSSYLFWYVAPDDFTGKDVTDSASSSRYVNAVFRVKYADNTTEKFEQKICIVRPPLMLVHGLGGDPSTWDNFTSYISGTTKFIDDYRFKTVVPVKLDPSASFTVNAYRMTVGNAAEANTFAGVISKMRERGYAANRVDYVGHSMGGCVLRSAIDNYYAHFTRTGAMATLSYKNYEQGYVNKVITIGTPHNSSPWADILNRYLDLTGAPSLDWSSTMRMYLWDIYHIWGNKAFPFMFLKPVDTQAMFPWEYKITDAVRDLQISSTNGGVNFSSANVKAHLIAGDFFPGTQANLPGGLIPQETIDAVKNSGNNVLEKFLNKLLQQAVAKETDPTIKAKLMWAITRPEPVEQALSFLDELAMAMDAFNIGTFLPESDLVVGVGSQLSTYSKTDSNVSVFDNFVAHAFFRAETANKDIGTKTMELLNTSISSNKFNSIPATNNKMNDVNQLASLNSNSFNSYKDTNRIKIIQPQNNLTVYVNSTLNIKLRIKDTANLLTLNVYFQNTTYSLSTKLLGDIGLSIQVNSNVLTQQKLTVEAFYNYADSAVLAYDEITLNVVPTETLTGFSANPQIMYLFINETAFPDYNAVYQTYSTSLGNFSQNISSTVNDSTIVKFDSKTKGFKGIKQGETFAVVSYEAMKDTIYFVVEKDTMGSKATGIKEELLAGNAVSKNQIKVYPNPFTGTTTIEYQLSQPSSVRIKVYNIMGSFVAEVVNEKQEKGTHKIMFSGNDLSNGVYICEVKVNGESIRKKMVLMK